MIELAKQEFCKLFGTSPKSGDIGIELEIEGENLPKEFSGWHVKPEGSLRGKGGRQVSPGENAPDIPFEYTFQKPVGVSAAETKLRALHKALTTGETKVTLTPRGSTHIHVNMQHETVRTVFGFIIIYAIIEPALLRLCGPKRNGNLFCLPTYECGELAFAAGKMAAALIVGLNQWPARRGRYASLNTDALLQFGSLEVRCFPNEIDPDKIMEWVKWLINIRDLARSWQNDTFLDLLDRAYNEPLWMLAKIFGDKNFYNVLQPTSPHELVQFGVEMSYEIAKAFQPALESGPPKMVETKKPKKKPQSFGVPTPTYWGSIETAPPPYLTVSLDEDSN